MDNFLQGFLIAVGLLGWVLFALAWHTKKEEQTKRALAELSLEQYMRYAEALKVDLDRVLNTVVVNTNKPNKRS